MDLPKVRLTLRRFCVDLYGFLCDYVNISMSFFSLSGPTLPRTTCHRNSDGGGIGKPGRRNTQSKTWSRIILHQGPKLGHQPEASAIAGVITNQEPRRMKLLLLYPP